MVHDAEHLSGDEGLCSVPAVALMGGLPVGDVGLKDLARLLIYDLAHFYDSAAIGVIANETEGIAAALRCGTNLQRGKSNQHVGSEIVEFDDIHGAVNENDKHVFMGGSGTDVLTGGHDVGGGVGVHVSSNWSLAFGQDQL